MKRNIYLFFVLAVVLCVGVAVWIATMPKISKTALQADQINSIYRVTDEFLQQAEQNDTAIEQLILQAKDSGANALLWDTSTENNKLLKDMCKQAAQQQVGIVLVQQTDDSEQQKKQNSKYSVSGICESSFLQNGLEVYRPITEGLLPIVVPDETGAEFYSLWATGNEMVPVYAGTDGQNQTSLYSQLKNGVDFVQTALVKNPSLAIGIPQPKQSTTAEIHFAAGTADPHQPLTVNNEAVEVSEQGVWGIPILLQDGENTITATQGGQSVSVVITKTKPKEGVWTPLNPVSDGSQPLEKGQKIQITSAIASLLSDYQDDDSILQTVYRGAVAQVEEAVSFTRGTKQTYAYRVADGWILAKDCKPLSENTLALVSAGEFRQEDRNSIFRLDGGTPLIKAERTENSLQLFLSGVIYSGETWSETGLADSIHIEPTENGCVLSFAFAPNALWGWSVDYPDNACEIVLKSPPTVSQNAATPLQGITVLLDPGHGAEDLGALGPMGPYGPCEKDLNLSVALAAKQRLEQIGATVLLSRDSDVFPTLAERNQMLRNKKPDIFVSVHHNSTPLTKDLREIKGVECYYFYPSGQLLAQNLADTISRFTNRKNRGDKYNYFYVTRSDICPAVLLETGFTPNPAEYSECVSAQGIAKAGFAIAQGIENTIKGIVPAENSEK